MTAINNVVCSWSMIQLQTDLEGESPTTPLLVSATAINWSAQRKMDNIYGLGGQPRGRGFGNVEYSASIELDYSAQVSLRSKSANGTFMGLGQFNLVVSFVNDMAQNIPAETVTLAGCVFTEDGFDAKQDDTSLTHTFDLHPYRIYTSTSQAANASWSSEMYAGA